MKEDKQEAIIHKENSPEVESDQNQGKEKNQLWEKMTGWAISMCVAHNGTSGFLNSIFWNSTLSQYKY